MVVRSVACVGQLELNVPCAIEVTAFLTLATESVFHSHVGSECSKYTATARRLC
jgi:hypothetical protein